MGWRARLSFSQHAGRAHHRTTTAADDKQKPDKQKDSPAGPPTLPDEKELERRFREWLKESEKNQPKTDPAAATVQTLAASATYSLPDSAYTNFVGGFYGITRITDDTDADGLPDWWEPEPRATAR